MTSSYKATGHASVRGTPASQLGSLGAWSPVELTLSRAPSAQEPVVDATPTVTPEMIAAERASLIEEGYARGVVEGMQQGLAQGRSQFSDVCAALGAVMRDIGEVASLAPALLEENIAALAIIVARQIISREVALDRDIVAGLVRRALTEFPIDQPVRIRVNPVDLTMLTAATSASESAPITGSREATWLADPRIARGGCLVEGRERIVDGRVDTALERAYRQMSKTDAT